MFRELTDPDSDQDLNSLGSQSSFCRIPGSFRRQARTIGPPHPVASYIDAYMYMYIADLFLMLNNQSYMQVRSIYLQKLRRRRRRRQQQQRRRQRRQ